MTYEIITHPDRFEPNVNATTPFRTFQITGKTIISVVNATSSTGSATLDLKIAEFFPDFNITGSIIVTHAQITSGSIPFQEIKYYSTNPLPPMIRCYWDFNPIGQAVNGIKFLWKVICHEA